MGKAEGSASRSESSSSSSGSPMDKAEGSSSVSVPETSASANGGLVNKGEAPSELDRTARDQLKKGQAPSELDRTAREQLGKAADDPSAAPMAESSSSPAGAADASAPPSPSPEPSPSDSSGQPQDPAAGQEGQAPTEQELVEAYGQLSQPELELHAKAMAQVMAAKAGGAPGMSPSPSGPPPAGAAPMPGDNSPAVSPDMTTMKSENALLRAQVEELQKGLKAFADGFQDLMAPKQKAVTGMDIVPETKPSLLQLTKSEIGDKLKTVVRRSDLTKSERKLITAWYSGDASDQDLTPILSK